MAKNPGTTHDALDKEQLEIAAGVRAYREEFKGKRWTRLMGDIALRLVKHYLSRHLPDSVRLVPYAYVEASGLEHDLVVVDRNARSRRFTNLYARDRVHAIIEVKGAGPLQSPGKLGPKLRKLRARISEETGKPFLYLSLSVSERRYDIVMEAFGRENAFVFKRRRKRKIPGEWGRFVERVRECVTA